MAENTIQWDKDADGIVTLTMDDPTGSANVMNEHYTESMHKAVERLVAEKDSITGVVITSAKKTFFAGGDLKGMIQPQPEDAGEVFSTVEGIKRDLRTMETLGKPVVAAINGAALGGGLEIALACHHRIAADVKGLVVGFPEVTLGLLPGGGGVTRTVRMFGIQNAFMNVLSQGTRFKPAQAKETGLVDELVGSVEELVPAAKAWIKANPDAIPSRGTRRATRCPAARLPARRWPRILPSFPALLRKQLKGAPMPAPRAILDAAVEGAQVDFDTASRIESRYFTELVTGQVAKNMIQAFFFDLQTITGGGSRPDGIGKTPINKIGVLGAGMMGAGIAYVSAKAGFDVVLKDVSDRGRGEGQGLLREARSQGAAAGQDHRGEVQGAAGPDHADGRRRRLRGRRLRDRGGVREPGTQAQGVPGDRGHRRAQRAARVEHLHAADHRSGDWREAAGGLHRDPLLLAGRQDAAGGNHQGREDI